MNNNTDDRSPDEHIAENELICEKLLGWRRIFRGSASAWQLPSNLWTYSAPSFTAWAEAGLILDAWVAAGNDYDIDGTAYESGAKILARLRQIKGISYVGDFGCYKETAPLAIRAAALEYIRSQP